MRASIPAQLVRAVLCFGLGLCCAFAAPAATDAPVNIVESALQPSDAPAWANRLGELLADSDLHHDGELGVAVVDLASGTRYSYRGDEAWYLASGVKLPVAVAVLRAVQDGRLALHGRVALLAEDLVDGAGPTKRRVPGSRLRIDWLLEQMLVHSDNTASDVLIRQVGLGEVNAVAAELMDSRCGHITTLADVRRLAYGHLHRGAAALRGSDLLQLAAAPYGRARYEALAALLGAAPGELALADLASAFEAYYASAVNSAPLDAYAQMLVAVAEGRALDAQHTGYLMQVLSRVETGRRRILAGLPSGTRFAHKTGTQLRRQCDFGIVSVADAETGTDRHIAVAACVRGARSLARGESALRAVGQALAASGLLPSADATQHATAATKATGAATAH